MNTPKLWVLICLFLALARDASAGEPKMRPRHADELERDLKLHVSFNLDTSRPDLGHILEKLRAATGLEIETAAELANHQPDFGSIQPSKKGWHAFTIMRIVASRELENGRWEKTDRGYRLVGKSLAAAPTPAAGKPAGASLWLVGGAVLLGATLLSVGGFCVLKKRRLNKAH